MNCVATSHDFQSPISSLQRTWWWTVLVPLLTPAAHHR